MRWVYFALKRRGLCEMLLTSTTTCFRFSFWAYPPSFSAHIRAYFFTNNKPTITLPVCFIPVSLPVHTPDLHNTVFPPNTILSPDSFPFVSLPTDHQLELPDILCSEILDQSISRMTIIHIFCYNCCNLIFLLSWCHSPFIYHFRRDALNQGPLLKSFSFANQLPATPYKSSLCLLFTGAWHAPVIRSSSRIFTNESSHAFHTYPNTLVLPFPVLPRLVLF